MLLGGATPAKAKGKCTRPDQTRARKESKEGTEYKDGNYGTITVRRLEGAGGPAAGLQRDPGENGKCEREAARETRFRCSRNGTSGFGFHKVFDRSTYRTEYGVVTWQSVGCSEN